MARRTEEFLGGFAQILGGLTGLVDRLENLAEQANERLGEGEIRDADGAVRGVYGFQVKVGIGANGQRDVQVQPFGHTPSPRPEPADAPAAPPAREPIVDLFEEADALIVIAELPGVAAEDVGVHVEGDRMRIEASRHGHRYVKELQLPHPVDPGTVTTSGANGVVEIRCPR